MGGKCKYGILTAVLALLLAAISCRKEEFRTGDQGSDSHPSGASREEMPMQRRVLLLYAAGFNSLSDYLTEDIEDLAGGDYIPGCKITDPVLLVFSRLTLSRFNYTNETAPALFRIYKDGNGNVLRDTLAIPGFDTHTVATSGETMRSVLRFVKDRFPAASYGMIFSSHGTGWLPEGYYSDPWEEQGGNIWSVGKRSLGQDLVGSHSYEMSLQDLHDAIPMHLNYMILDACLMGGVEVAWSLRGIVDTLAFSQTEILADGFDYPKIARRLLVRGESGVVGACRDYFDQYDVRTGNERSATVSVIDLEQMDDLAGVCASLFEKYRSVIATMNPNPVQRYYRSGRHWFYDLEDILLHAGITAEEQAQLSAALERCTVYKAATPSFLSIDINHFSGLSMMLPSNAGDALKTWYRENIAWNDATALVE